MPQPRGGGSQQGAAGQAKVSGVPAGFSLLGGETLGRVENLRDRRRQGPARIICAVLQQHTGLSCWRHILIALILCFFSKLTCRCETSASRPPNSHPSKCPLTTVPQLPAVLPCIPPHLQHELAALLRQHRLHVRRHVPRLQLVARSALAQVRAPAQQQRLLKPAVARLQHLTVGEGIKAEGRARVGKGEGDRSKLNSLPQPDLLTRSTVPVCRFTPFPQ